MSDNNTEESLKFTADVTATLYSGVKVPMRIIVEYPEDMGSHAYDALGQMSDIRRAFLEDLINSGDASIIARARRAGLLADDNEDAND